MFKAEDPENFAERLRNAVQSRREVENLLRLVPKNKNSNKTV